MPLLSAYFAEPDRAWSETAGPRIALHLIGSTALMLQTNYRRGTKDGDVLQTAALTPAIQRDLLRLAGPASALRSRHRLYLEIVPGGLPFLPQQPRWHDVEFADVTLHHVQLRALDVVDVVVSKLLRMHANDLADIDAMIKLGRVPHASLLDRFRAAVDMFAYDARGPDLPRYIANLHRVERDMLGVDESEITLPGWL